MMCSRVSMIVVLRRGGCFPDGANLLSDINAHRAPGDATAATDAARTAKLVNPGGELVGHPLAVARFGGTADIATVNVRKILRKTGVPFTPALGVRTADIADILDRGAEAGGTDHGAIGAGQATVGDVLPARMIEVVIEQI